MREQGRAIQRRRHLDTWDKGSFRRLWRTRTWTSAAVYHQCPLATPSNRAEANTRGPKESLSILCSKSIYWASCLSLFQGTSVLMTPYTFQAPKKRIQWWTQELPKEVPIGTWLRRDRADRKPSWRSEDLPWTFLQERWGRSRSLSPNERELGPRNKNRIEEHKLLRWWHNPTTEDRKHAEGGSHTAPLAVSCRSRVPPGSRAWAAAHRAYNGLNA